MGRDGERARIKRAMTAARQGGSAVVVVRGEAGAGKTGLLEDAIGRARGLKVVRTRGADPDGEQPFAGLVELCRPLLDRLDDLPAGRAAALSSALGMGAPRGTVDRFAVYAGMLGLLAAVAEETPILAVVDDAHLLDEASAEAVAFISRRLRIDGIALLIATNPTTASPTPRNFNSGGSSPQTPAPCSRLASVVSWRLRWSNTSFRAGRATRWRCSRSCTT